MTVTPDPSASPWQQELLRVGAAPVGSHSWDLSPSHRNNGVSTPLHVHAWDGSTAGPRLGFGDCQALQAHLALSKASPSTTTAQTLLQPALSKNH